METTLRKIRKARKLTLRGLAEKTGIVYTRVWRHEKRVEPLFPRDVERYCRVLEVAPEDIRDGGKLAKVVDEVDGMVVFSVPAAAVEQGGVLFVVAKHPDGRGERYSLPLSDVARKGTALIEGDVLKSWIIDTGDLAKVED